MGGIVFVHRLLVGRMMPMVELRGHHDVAQPPQVHPDIGMDDHRLHADEQHVGENRILRESQKKNGNQHQGPGRQRLQEMQARSRQPVHRIRRMMDGMHPPQRRHLMHRPMRHIFHQISRQNHQHEPHHPRQRQDVRLHPWVHRPGEIILREMGGHHHEHANRQMVDPEITEIELPPLPQRRLMGAHARKHRLQQREHGPREEQVEHHPVEAQINLRLLEIGRGYIGPAEQHGEEKGGEAQGRPPARPPQSDRQNAQPGAGDHRDRQHQPQQFHVVMRAQRRGCQEGRETQAQDGGDAEQADGGAKEAADPALAHFRSGNRVWVRVGHALCSVADFGSTAAAGGSPRFSARGQKGYCVCGPTGRL